MREVFFEILLDVILQKLNFIVIYSILIRIYSLKNYFCRCKI